MKSETWRRSALSPFVVLALAACSTDDDSTDGAPSDRDSAIIEGSVAKSYPEAVLVDMYFGSQLGAYCSGSLVAPRVVLTAGHCVHAVDRWKVTAPFADKQTATATSGETYDWDTDSEAVDPSMHDIGLIYLDAPISLSTYPSLPKAHVKFGSKVRNIGRIHDGSLSTTQLFIGAQTEVIDGAQLGFPFDYASNDIIESGDSGGPVIKASSHEIVAVNSGGGRQAEVLARTDLLHDWILEQIASHGGEGGTTTPKAPSTGCGSVTFEGTCSGNIVKWCEDDEVHQLSCGSSHETCGFNQAKGYYDCL